MIMQKIEAVLFDLDGILLNSEGVWFEAFNEVLENYGKNKISREDYDNQMTGSFIDEDIFNYFGEIEEKKLNEIRMKWMNVIIKRVDKITLYPHAKEVIAQIKNLGHKVGCVTNTPNYLTDKFLQFFDLADKFDTIITGDMTENKKPFPDPVLLACKKLNVSPENCAFVEDSTRGVEAGRKAGALTIAITTSFDKSKLKEAGADIIIDSLSDLFKYI